MTAPDWIKLWLYIWSQLLESNMLDIILTGPFYGHHYANYDIKTQQLNCCCGHSVTPIVPQPVRRSGQVNLVLIVKMILKEMSGLILA